VGVQLPQLVGLRPATDEAGWEIGCALQRGPARGPLLPSFLEWMDRRKEYPLIFFPRRGVHYRGSPKDSGSANQRNSRSVQRQTCCTAAESPPWPRTGRWYSDEGLRLAQRLLHPKPTRRLPLSDALKHPYLRLEEDSEGEARRLA
jgi:hypothetical protein